MNAPGRERRGFEALLLVSSHGAAGLGAKGCFFVRKQPLVPPAKLALAARSLTVFKGGKSGKSTMNEL